jgi:hypothetical protein
VSRPESLYPVPYKVAARPGIPYTQDANSEAPMRRVLIGTPSLGTVRMEWHNAMSGLVIPCNWSNSMASPIGFLVADAQNLIVKQVLDNRFDWLLLLEDDVMPPPDLFLRFERYMDSKEVPIVSGLYHVKGPSQRREPMIYRGRGNGTYRNWTDGDLVWADGVPTGCLLVHRTILEGLARTAERYTLRPVGGSIDLLRIFETPRAAAIDMGTGAYMKTMGTSDLHFCEQVIAKKVLATAGWPALQKRRYPFLVDTGIACGHIDRHTGQVF